MKYVLCVSLILGLSGCGILDLACPEDAPFSIAVLLLDSITGRPVVAEGITVIATDGAFSDTVRFSGVPPQPDSKVGIVENRPGTYRVEVTANGYRPWVRIGVRVREGSCNRVEIVNLVAQMQRLDSG